MYAAMKEAIPGDFSKALVYSYPNIRVELRLKATGHTRHLSESGAAFLSEYVKAKSVPASFASAFTDEVEVREGSHTIWVLMQNGLIDAYRSELGHGGALRLLALLGGAKDGNLVLLTIAFESIDNSAAKQ
jgi:hypothetical protein